MAGQHERPMTADEKIRDRAMQNATGTGTRVSGR